MFQSEFSELKNSLDKTVTRNPILTKEQEHFVFSCISCAKNRIFGLALHDADAYSTFASEVAQIVSKGDAHEIFMTQKFEGESEYDSNFNKTMKFVDCITNGNCDDVIKSIRSYNISYDIFSTCLSVFLEKHSNNKVIDILLSDMNYYIEKIYLSNVKIVLRILSAYRNTDGMTVKDLFSEGMIGLRRAIELYNCDLGIKFSTYASQWIKASINRAIADKESLIRIPVNVREQSREVERIRKELKSQLGYEPSDEEIIEKMKKKVSSLANIDISFNYYQIDLTPKEQSELGNSTVTASFEENLVDVNIMEETDSVTIKDVRHVIRDYIESVNSAKEKFYLQFHFGLNESNDIKSKEEIMTELNILPNEYDRIRKRAISNIKKALCRNKVALDAYGLASGWDSHSNLEF